jgi:uncharacterized protein (DUF983 family)
MSSPFDRRIPVLPVDDRPPVVLPRSLWQALARGVRGRCPRCGRTRLFRAFLKPVDHFRRCNQDWTHQRADDFPAYVSLFVTGHVMAPIAVHLARDQSISVATCMAIILPLALLLAAGLLQPAKGAIITVQWWMGMHGFQRERIETVPGEARRRSTIFDLHP